MSFSVTVPEVFYDLIARFVPGGTLIIGLSLIHVSPTNLGKALNAGEFSLILILILLSYVTGFVLEAIFDLFKKYIVTFSGFPFCEGKYPEPIIETINELLANEYVKHDKSQDKQIQQLSNEELKQQRKQQLEQLSNKQLEHIYCVTSEWIRLKKPELGTLLLKIDAEVTMLGSLLVAFVFFLMNYMCSSIIDMLHGCSPHPCTKLFWAVLFLILAGLTFYNIKRLNTIRFNQWTWKFYSLYKIDKEERVRLYR